MKNALLIGNSDGIGLAVTKWLLSEKWHVLGMSRSESPIRNHYYTHMVVDVCRDDYLKILTESTIKNHFSLCIYFVGVGELLNLKDMRNEPIIIDANLSGMVKTATRVIPQMVEKGNGHFIGISSLADDLLSSESPSYHASKAGFSNYLGGLALALKPHGIFVTNIRFGFVDTKMAKGDVKPFMMSVEKAVDHIRVCIRKKPVSYTAPRIAIPLVKFRKLIMWLGVIK